MEMQVLFSPDRQYYSVAGVEVPVDLLWLSVTTYPLPVPSYFQHPTPFCACLNRGRNYYRVGTAAPQRVWQIENKDSDDPLVSDFRDASWWTPGLEEAWVEIQGLQEALSEATRLHVCGWIKD
jgi:hypothetical protein